jgi:hypothetical protein
MMTDPKIMPLGRRARTPSLSPREQPRASLRVSPWPTPVLRFSPTAWAKLLCLRDLDDCEVGAFGISAADDLLYVEQIELVRQLCDLASVAFDDESVADFFDRQVDAGRRPEQFARIWIHTHPGSCPQPSSVDEETFARVFGRSEWAVLFILAQGGKSYARLEFHVGPGGSVPLPVEVDYSREFAGSDRPAWQGQYQANVFTPMVPLSLLLRVYRREIVAFWGFGRMSGTRFCVIHCGVHFRDSSAKTAKTGRKRAHIFARGYPNYPTYGLRLPRVDLCSWFLRPTPQLRFSSLPQELGIPAGTTQLDLADLQPHQGPE